MRLFVHNFLQCHARGCEGANFPLPITPAPGNDAVEVAPLEADFSDVFLRAYLPRIDWPVMVATARALNIEGASDLPDAAPEDPAEVSEEVLRALHRVALEADVRSAQMICPSCEHVYLIRDGIPNMLLAEDEI